MQAYAVNKLIVLLLGAGALQAAQGGAAALTEIGISDVATFTAWYWDGQMGSARLLIGTTLAASLLGGLLYLPSAPRTARKEESDSVAS